MPAVAEQRLRGHRRGHVAQERQLLGVLDRQDAERARERGPVRDRQALLGFELEGLQAQLVKDVGGVPDLAAVQDLALADDGGAEVGKRHEVSAGAARAALRDHREDVVVK